MSLAVPLGWKSIPCGACRPDQQGPKTKGVRSVLLCAKHVMESQSRRRQASHLASRSLSGHHADGAGAKRQDLRVRASRGQWAGRARAPEQEMD